MNKKPYVLIVDDKLEWITLFRRVLASYYEPLEAHSFDEAREIISKHGTDIGIAIVDIRLGDDINYAGLDVIISLKPYKIRAVAVSGYNDPIIVRRAFVQGNVLDFCFKGDDLVNDLRYIVNTFHPIDVQENFSSAKVEIHKPVSKEAQNLWRIFSIIFLSTILVFGTLTIVANQTSSDILGIVIGAGIFLILVLILSALLVLRQISRKDFKDLFKFVTKNKKSR